MLLRRKAAPSRQLYSDVFELRESIASTFTAHCPLPVCVTRSCGAIGKSLPPIWKESVCEPLHAGVVVAMVSRMASMASLGPPVLVAVYIAGA